MSRAVYINKISKFLPNKPVSNDQIEERLGYVYDKPARSKSVVLRSNKIENRFYEHLFLKKFGQHIEIQSPHKLKIILNLMFPQFNFILIYKCSQ